MTVTTIDHSEREELRELWHEAINGTVALAANLAEAHEEITKLRERCEAYKGQVESGAAEIERLRAERDLWIARCAGALWMIPGHVTLGDIRLTVKWAQTMLPVEQPPPEAGTIGPGTYTLERVERGVYRIADPPTDEQAIDKSEG
jgi:hypothetical protein